MAKGRTVWIDWNGQSRRRRDVIEELRRSGMAVADIARRLGVRYQIVYLALRTGAGVARTAEGAAPIAGEMPGTASDAILVGCVKTKADRPLPARDLYISELFRRRRAYADATGVPWWVLSAEYGLVEQQRVIAPYDTLIGGRPLAERRALAAGVRSDLEDALGPLTGRRIEIHAGDEYVQTVGPTLRAAGATIVRPLQGLSQGEQLHWYGERLGWAAKTRPGETAEPRTSPARSIALGDGRGLGRLITNRFMTGELDLSTRSGAPPPGWDGMPEVIAVRALMAEGAKPATIRLFLTFNAAMDRARDADRLARAAVRLFAELPWTFDPAEITKRPVRDLADALRVTGVSQRHSTDAYGWRLLAETLADPSLAPHARSAIHAGRADAVDLRAELWRTSPGGSPLFPLLSGPKIGPLWIRLLSYPGGAAISSLETVPVAVDVQVRKVTEYLGVTDTGGLSLDDARPVIQQTWAADVARHGAAGPAGLANTPGALDPALWFYAKWGCTFCQRAGERRPISDACESCRFPSTS
jgi:hypothetical protein